MHPLCLSLIALATATLGCTTFNGLVAGGDGPGKSDTPGGPGANGEVAGPASRPDGDGDDPGGGSGTDGDGGEGGDGDTGLSPGPRFVGRFDTQDARGPRANWPGSRAVYRFEGTGLEVTLGEAARGGEASGGESHFDVIVDGQVGPTPLAPSRGEKAYEVAAGLAAGVHVVELRRRSEATTGTTQFVGYKVAGGQILSPPQAPERRVEFVGDSASAGYGVECASAEENYSAATQNEAKAYPALAAGLLGAEHHNVSFSGKGVFRNYDSDPVTFAALYPRTLALVDDAANSWTFGAWVPHVVVIGLGANDYDPGSPPRPPPRRDRFKAKYHELVALVRDKNPSAKILLTVSSSLIDDYPPGYDAYTNVTGVLQEVAAERKGAPTNDPNVFYLELPRADRTEGTGDLTGCDFHPNAKLHQRTAPVLAAKISEIAGWQ